MVLRKIEKEEDAPLDEVTVFSSLGNCDALKIFLASEKGIENSTKAIKELGLTQKRYYTWLKRLTDTGLVEKRTDIYQQTLLGKICYKFWQVLRKVLKHKDQLKLADKLMTLDLFSEKDTEKFLGDISGRDLFHLIRPVKMFSNWDELVEELAILIDRAKKSLYLASYYPDIRIVETILEASKRGLQMSFLAGYGKKEEIPQMLRLLLSPSLTKVIYNFLESGSGVNVRKISIPYCFSVIDEEYAVFEIPHPVERKFVVAFLIHDEDVSHRLINIFNSLYEKGEEIFPIKYLR